MGKACRALDFPIISGNVSLYNETNGQAILPTPVVGGVGLLKDAALRVGVGLTKAGLSLFVLGETTGWLGCSRYREIIDGVEFEAPPAVDLALEKRHGDFVRSAVAAGLLAACHDVSDGGLLVALTEMALAGGQGVAVTLDAATPGVLFGEDQGRYVLATDKPEALIKLAAGLPLARIGVSGGDAVVLNEAVLAPIAELRSVFEAVLPKIAA
jgi:phosphoribosylformylglycinamidine synthase